MLWAAFTMAFYGFFRVGELVNLHWSDVSFSPDRISITLCQSKTDPFRRGCTVKIFKTNSSTCPYHAMDHYRKVTGEITPSTPLYQAGRIHPLSCAAVTTTLRQFLKKQGLIMPITLHTASALERLPLQLLPDFQHG